MRPALGSGRLGLGRQCGGVPHRVGQGQQVIGARLLRSGRHGQAQDFPAPGNGEGVSMLFAQIVTMGFSVSSQRTEDCSGVGIDVRQGSHR
ncbi:MAG: hypothetical protein JWQ56_3609 [Pseudarthrobacter sp.]|nr:hypothetical protein [Pseudarthrobacter sp.]